MGWDGWIDGSMDGWMDGWTTTPALATCSKAPSPMRATSTCTCATAVSASRLEARIDLAGPGGLGPGGGGSWWQKGGEWGITAVWRQLEEGFQVWKEGVGWHGSSLELFVEVEYWLRNWALDGRRVPSLRRWDENKP